MIIDDLGQHELLQVPNQYQVDAVQDSMKDTLELNCERANEIASLNLLLSEKRQELITNTAKGKRGLSAAMSRRMSRRVPSGSFTVPAMPDTILRDLPLPTYRQVDNVEVPSNERAMDSSAEQFLDQRSNSQ